MKNLTRAATVLLLLLMFVRTAGAQSPRTWVSGVGDDANPASRTAPCKTFAGAIAKTQAGGEIDALDPGGFGVVTITKSITIDGGGGKMGGILFAGTNGVVVNSGASDTVILRRLTLDGAGTGLSGIRVFNCGVLVVEDCDIESYTQSGIDFSPTSGGRLVVRNTTISNGPTGMKVSISKAGNNVSADTLLVTATTNAIDLLAGTIDLSNSTISLNTGAGLFAEGGTINSINNVVNGNGQDVKFTSGTVKTFDNNGPIGISLTQDVTTATVSAGQSATYNLTVAPPPGGFAQPVSFAAVGLPSSLRCVFNPTSLPAGASTSPVTMTVSPAQAVAVLPEMPIAAGLVLALPLLGLGLASRRPVRARLTAASLGVLVLFAAARMAHAAPVTGTFSFTVTASSGTTAVSQLFTVVIK